MSSSIGCTYHPTINIHFVTMVPSPLRIEYIEFMDGFEFQLNLFEDNGSIPLVIELYFCQDLE